MADSDGPTFPSIATRRDPGADRSMRILAFDHFFWQDLDELSRLIEPENEMVRISYQRWHREAHRYFPVEAFDGIANAYSPELSKNWQAYRKWVEQETAWLINAYQPNLFVTPSDSFFYLRPFIASLKSFGVNTFVLQKETTISPMVMEVHSEEIGRFVPFMSDFMTVCSERHKQFWLKAGTNPDLISVTGQPRFDIYKRDVVEGPSKVRRATKILYLSYDDSAYLPSDLGSDFDGSWIQQRQETEMVLADISHTKEVTAKKHPQQTFAEDWIGENANLADRFADTRSLIVETDVVVGFQTTALYEAAVAGKPTIYAAWGEVFENNKESLIRFDLASELVTHALSPDHLRELLSQRTEDLPKASEAGLRLVNLELGPIDGKATERTWELMQEFCSTPILGSVSSLDLFTHRMQVIASYVYGLVAAISKIIFPSKTEGIKRRQNIARQISNERRRISRQLKEASVK
jgi:hypothetical protein